MTAQRFTDLPKATDSNDEPLSGAVWRFYASGTLTPQAVYTDATLAVALGTSVTANSAGQFAPIYFDPQFEYRAILRTSGGSLIADIDPANSIVDPTTETASSAITFKQSGIGATDRTAEAKMRECVSPADFGAVGDGIVNDTNAFNNALTTGKSIALESGKNYKITSPLALTASGQKVFMNGATVTAAGAFATGVFSISGGLHSCGVFDGVFEGAGMTSGYMVHIANADRTTVRGLRGHSPANFLYARKTNLVAVEDNWINGITGQYGLRWYGDASNRSDVMRVAGLNLSFVNGGTGIMWQGNCHTMQLTNVTVVQPGVGFQVEAVSGLVPLFLLADDLEIDFPQSHGVHLKAGEDFYFSELFYCHGSVTGSGIRIEPAVPHDRVIIAGGKITSHSRYGIDNPSTRVKGGHMIAFNNALGNNSGTIYVRSDRLEVDDRNYMTLSSGNPIINWDANDADLYDRTNNIRSFDINSVSRLRLNNASNAVQLYVGGALKVVEVGAADSAGAGYRTLRVQN